jgi:hypothetical protein
MLRLLLPKKQKEVRGEYLRRFSILLVDAEARLLAEQVRVATDDTLNTEQRTLTEQIAVYKRRVEILDEAVQPSLSPLLRSVTASQSPQITIASISSDFRENELGTETALILQGVAQNRQALARFQEELVATGDFDLVDLPLSSFARDTNIPFAITLVVEPKGENTTDE